MQHLDVMMDPGYDEDGFRVEAGRMRLFGGGGGKAKPPPPPAPEPPPQPPSLPQDAQNPLAARARARAGANVFLFGVAPASTFLTGPSGIDDSTLLLGRNKLLGQ